MEAGSGAGNETSVCVDSVFIQECVRNCFQTIVKVYKTLCSMNVQL